VQVNNGLSLDRLVAQIVLKDVTHAQMVSAVSLAQLVIRNKETSVLYALLELIPLLPQLLALIVIINNGLQLDLPVVPIVLKDVTLAQMVPLVMLALLGIKKKETIVLDVLQIPILLPARPVALVAELNNGQLLNPPLVQVVLIIVMLALMVTLATLALRAMPKIQKIPVLCVQQALMPLLDLLLVLLVEVKNGL